MRVAQVLLARAVRYVDLLQPPYLPDLIQRLQERYQFVHVPITPEEILPRANPVGLLRGMAHGKFVHEGRTIVVESMTVFADAIAIDSPATTEDADLVLDDLLVHAADLMRPKPNRRAYNSGLAIELVIPLEAMFALAAPVSKALSNVLAEYSPDDPPVKFKLETVKFVSDATDGGADTFEVERVAGTNILHSHAPLSTPHHAAFWETLEEAIRAAVGKATSSPTEPPPPSSQSPSSSDRST